MTGAACCAVRWGHSRLPIDSGSCKRPGAHAGSPWGCSLSHVYVDALLLQGKLWPHRVVRQQVLEPFWAFDMPRARAIPSWTHALRGRTVLLVHGFAAILASQAKRVAASAIWGAASDRILPPDMRLKYVRAPMNVGGASDGQRDWKESLAALVADVDAVGRFDVALVACGGLGMLLAAHLRTTNRYAVYVGGWLQVWLGIMGSRWDEHTQAARRHSHPLARAYAANMESWTRPLPQYTPKHTSLVEGSAYW